MINLDTVRRLSGLMGESEAIREVLAMIAQISPTDISVLVTGESGTGKDRIAQAIHKSSPRKFGPLITVNCGAIPVGIIESELFGHVKGSFTGADASRKGYFEAAHEGSIFLDEIGETPLETQVKLLRVIEQGEFMPVGGTKTRKVDVRVIAATNRDLGAEVRKGNFRQDLYYRLKTVTIHMPPLREHVDDLAQLVERFGLEFAARNNLSFRGFTPDALRLMRGYSWPGNVRELKNIVESVGALHPGERITPELITGYMEITGHQYNPALPVVVGKSPEQSDRDLIIRQLLYLRQDMEEIKRALSGQPGLLMPVDPYMPGTAISAGAGQPVFQQDISQLEQRALIDPDAIGEITIEDLEKEIISLTLNKYNQNRRRTAELLGIAERTLYRKISQYGLDKK